MIRAIAGFALFGCLAFGSAAEESKPDIPESCEAAIAGQGDDLLRWKSCFEDAEPNSGPWFLAAMNLGTEAFYRNDHETAASYYRQTMTERFKTFSDIILHANRAATFETTGDTAFAEKDAMAAWRLFQRGETLMPGVPLDDGIKGYVLVNILEPLQQADPDAFETAKAAYLALPLEDLQDRANRAALLQNIGELDAAIEESETLLVALPDNAQVLNNHCYMLHEAGRDEEAETYCRQALEIMPDAAPIKHSLASVLAGLGQCEQAETLRLEAKAASPSTAAYDEKLACTPGG